MGLQEAGREREALPLAQQALAIRRELLGEGHPACAMSLNGLGAIHFGLGEHARARTLFEEALSTYAKALGDDYPACAT
jgi:hypothetical protein